MNSLFTSCLRKLDRIALARILSAALAIAGFLLTTAGTSYAQEAGTAQKLTLKEAVNLAMRNSRDLALARLQYGLVLREAGLTRSAFLPNLYAGTGAAYTSGFPIAAGGGAPAVFNLTYNQQIFNPPLKGDQHAAEQRAEGQRLAMDGVRDAVMVQAALEYLELAKVRHALDLLRGERLSAGRILETVRDRSEAGRELPIEVTRAQLTTARIEQRILQLEDRDDELAGKLRDTMGISQDVAIEVSAEDLPAATDGTKDLVALAMSGNSDIKQAEAERNARAAKLKGERGGFWPTIALTGQYNVLSKINNYNDFFNKFQRNNVIFGLEVRIPIFASRTSASVAFAQANLNAAELTLQKKRSELSLDVRRKARQVREAELGGDVARLELQLSQENLRVLQAQFDLGRGSLKDLEAAHIEENDRWLSYLDANYARQLAELELLRSTGQVASVLQ